MRLIDADELIEIINYTFSKPPFSRKTIKNMIDMARTVDAVPVVRCKDCIWNREKEWVDCYMSGMHGRNINNFCSQGKRREE